MGLLDDAIREHLELKRRHGADNAEISKQEREVFGGGQPVDTPPAAEEFGAEPGPAIDPIEDSPLASEPEHDPAPLDEDPLFPHTDELISAGADVAEPIDAPAAPEPAPSPAREAATPPPPPAPAPAPRAAEPSLTKPAPAGSDAETAARSGARRLSEDELAAWRQRLSERADRLAAQRHDTGAAPAAPAPAPAPAPAAKPQPAADEQQPPPVWSAREPASPPPDPGVPVDFFDAGDAERAFAPEPAPEPEAADHDVLDETPDFLEETPEHDRMWFEQRPPRDFDFG